MIKLFGLTQHQKIKIKTQNNIDKIYLTTKIKNKNNGVLFNVYGTKKPNPALSTDKAYIMIENHNGSSINFMLKIGDDKIGSLAMTFFKHRDENSSDEIGWISNTNERFSYVGQALEEFAGRISPIVSGNHIITLYSLRTSIGFHREMGYREDDVEENGATTKMSLDHRQAPSGPDSPRRTYDLLNPSKLPQLNEVVPPDSE